MKMDLRWIGRSNAMQRIMRGMFNNRQPNTMTVMRSTLEMISIGLIGSGRTYYSRFLQTESGWGGKPVFA